MQAVLTKVSLMERTIGTELNNLFSELEGADNMTKSSIENKIVNYGESAINFLIDKLTGSKGVQRGVAAMSLIRIGETSVQALKDLANSNKNYTWVANYIIQEIEGTF